MAYLATLRSSQSHGGSGDFSVRSGSNDSPHFAQHEQVQLARRRQKACRSIGSKLADARSSASGQVLIVVTTQTLPLNMFSPVSAIFLNLLRSDPQSEGA